jgi:hypothetical protein
MPGRTNSSSYRNELLEEAFGRVAQIDFPTRAATPINFGADDMA